MFEIKNTAQTYNKFINLEPSFYPRSAVSCIYFSNNINTFQKKDLHCVSDRAKHQTNLFTKIFCVCKNVISK